jgi:dihydroflavonol-4-reductase
MKAFVTGGTGFLGGVLVRRLAEMGVPVRALVRPGGEARLPAGAGVEAAPGDLLDRDSLRDAMAGCDTVFHVAALYSTSEADAAAMYEVNVLGTKNVLRAAADAGVARMVHTSTIGTIGRGDGVRLPDESTEFDLWETCSHYARSKYLAELLALDLASSGLPVVVVNPTSPIGAGDVKPSSSGKRILDALEGRLGAFPPGGINFVSVRDVANGHILAAERGRVGQRYILGNREGNLTREQFTELLARITSLPKASSPRAWPLSRLRRRTTAPTRPGNLPQALTCDCRRAIEELGMPQTPLRDAFAEAVAWFADRGYLPARGAGAATAAGLGE